MRVFLDIGAHLGETLSVVRARKWGFDRIVCFEPAAVCWPKIRELADERVELCTFGLSDQDQVLTLHNPGSVGASLWAAKDTSELALDCDFRDAAAWFEDNVVETDTVYAKINVEGAEVGIIGRLAEAGQLGKIDHLLVHFDVRKIPGMEYLEDQARRQLDEAGIDYQLAGDIQFGGVYRGTRNWLKWVHGNPRTRDLRYKRIRRAGHAVRLRLYPIKRAVSAARRAGAADRSQ